MLMGREDLRSFLESRGETAAIQIRERLRGLRLEGFHRKAAKAGRRPYHPASLLGLILFGIVEGRHWLRQLATMARTDIRCWWVSGGIHPDPSVIGRLIQHPGDQLSEEFFIELTQRVLQLTGGRGGDLSGDGTVVPAVTLFLRPIDRLLCQLQARFRQFPSSAALFSSSLSWNSPAP
jgi:hypothetical protein